MNIIWFVARIVDTSISKDVDLFIYFYIAKHGNIIIEGTTRGKKMNSTKSRRRTIKKCCHV